MGRGQDFLDRLTEETEFSAQSLPGKTIVELAGDNRVLIENHFGVKAYSREKIIVNVKYGWVNVCGCGLEMMRMSKEQLVIRGKIEAISIQRR